MIRIVCIGIVLCVIVYFLYKGLYSPAPKKPKREEIVDHILEFKKVREKVKNDITDV